MYLWIFTILFLSVSWPTCIRWHCLLPIQWSPWDASVRCHFVILWMTGLWVSSDVCVSARASERKFGYLQVTPRHSLEFASPIVLHRDLDVILKDYEHNLIPDVYRRVPTRIFWAYAEGYITWFYRVSHPIMTQDTPGRSPKPSN